MFGREKSLVQVSAWGLDWLTVETLRDAIKTAIAQRVVVGAIDDRSVFEPDTRRYGASIDFSLML